MTQLTLALRKLDVMTDDTSGRGSKPLPSPRLADWQGFGMRVIRELSGGHQSRTFLGEINRQPVVAKLTDSRLVDRHLHDSRIRMLVKLAGVASGAAAGVVAPIRHCGRYSNQLGNWRVVVYPYVNGLSPNLHDSGDVSLMGRTLAKLHRAMAKLPPYDLAMVATLRVPGAALPADAPFQLLHGDFGCANLLFNDDGVRVFDFDDCGYGPVEFELGNSLFMVLFDATVRSDLPMFERFRRWFMDAYQEESRRLIDDHLVDEMIELRRNALRYWLDHLNEAPTGIRTSSPTWHATLRAFTTPPTDVRRVS
jgi:Ser/Thr protein kinase RdoA (MazF antagonist)